MSVHVTASIGIAVHDTNATGPDGDRITTDELLNSATDRMLQARQSAHTEPHGAPVQ